MANEVSLHVYNAAIPVQIEEHECRPDVTWNDDLPANFSTNKTHLCGVTWPQTTPLQNISACCSKGSPVEVSHACFHYCKTDREDWDFNDCVRRNFTPEVFGTHCNYQPLDGGSGRSTPLGMAWGHFGVLVVVLLVWMAALSLLLWRRWKAPAAVRLP